MKVLITGGSGALGRSLKEAFGGAYMPSSREMDVTDRELTRKKILEYRPDMLMHAAALVNIPKCEQEKKYAWNVNVEGVQNVVNALKELDNGCYLIYMSTACVFAGEKEKYYIEDDPACPAHYYGFTKLCGEIVTRQYPNTLIIRTNFAARGKWKHPKAFVDRFGTYLFTDQVVSAMKELISLKKTGLFHVVGDKRISMHELATLGGDTEVGKISLKEYNGPHVTVDMSMSTVRWKKYRIA